MAPMIRERATASRSMSTLRFTPAPLSVAERSADDRADSPVTVVSTPAPFSAPTKPGLSPTTSADWAPSAAAAAPCALGSTTAS